MSALLMISSAAPAAPMQIMPMYLNASAPLGSQFQNNPDPHYLSTVDVPYTFSAVVHNWQEDGMSARIVLQQDWEMENVDMFATFLWLSDQPTEVQRYLDIGANLCMHSLALASAGFEAVSVEPMPYNTEVIAANLGLNPTLSPRITAFAAAASNVSDTMCVVPSDLGGAASNLGNGQIVSPDSPRCTSSNLSAVALVPQLPVSDLVEGGNLSSCFAVMKIDTEGHEFLALQGMLRLFDTCRPCAVFFEYDEQYQDLRRDDMGISETAVQDTLTRLGYKCKRTAHSDLSADPIMSHLLPGEVGVSDEYACFRPDTQPGAACTRLWTAVEHVTPESDEWDVLLATTRAAVASGELQAGNGKARAAAVSKPARGALLP